MHEAYMYVVFFHGFVLMHMKWLFYAEVSTPIFFFIVVCKIFAEKYYLFSILKSCIFFFGKKCLYLVIYCQIKFTHLIKQFHI